MCPKQTHRVDRGRTAQKLLLHWSLGCLLGAHTASAHPESACSAPGDSSTIKQGDLWVGSQCCSLCKSSLHPPAGSLRLAQTGFCEQHVLLKAPVVARRPQGWLRIGRAPLKAAEVYSTTKMKISSLGSSIPGANDLEWGLGWSVSDGQEGGSKDPS